MTTHLNISELERLYRQAKNTVQSRQYQVIWLLAQALILAVDALYPLYSEQ
ncbi:MAG: hypothetical protein HC862_22625 [Scytonema sp. RU_4_4]|nr:hypothetical protein [Scytonema sp. RU_4_4]NJR74636.1 hypothetical protein [Scytonema sp. CRU_2_7]